MQAQGLEHFFIKIPCSADFPVATIIAVGVASPSAHGQATIKTETKFIKANVKLYPRRYHIKNVKVAIPITIGTNIDATLSASF